MKYEVYVETHFSSAHWLKNYKGKCERLHGHNWRVGVLVATDKLNKQDMVIDFTQLKRIVNKVVSQLDHRCLNSITFFKTRQTTAENIAYYIWYRLNKLLRKYNIQKIKVIVWETPVQYASYEE